MDTESKKAPGEGSPSEKDESSNRKLGCLSFRCLPLLSEYITCKVAWQLLLCNLLFMKAVLRKTLRLTLETSVSYCLVHTVGAGF